MQNDPRGPLVKITAVHRDPVNGQVRVDLSCGHNVSRVSHFSYDVGDDSRCLKCFEKEELADHIDSLEEWVAEFGAECANEVALFGDSGPGTGIQLAEGRAELARLKRKFDTLYPKPAPAPAPEFEPDDLPF